MFSINSQPFPKYPIYTITLGYLVYENPNVLLVNGFTFNNKYQMTLNTRKAKSGEQT